jgi:tight adherence protein C
MAPEVLIAVVGVFVMMCVVAGTTTSWVLARNTPEKRRLRAIAQTPGAARILADETLVEALDPRLAKLSRLLPKSPKEMTELQRTLTRAGYRSPRAVVVYSIAEVLLPLVLFFLTVMVLGFSGGLVLGLVLGMAGYIAPGLYVGHKTRDRQRAIRNGLPDALDLLTVCVEAGSGLDQAVSKAAEELRVSHPAVAEELGTVTTEIRAGKPRVEAFKNFGRRTGVDEVRSLVSMLTQTDRFGTSIADALRVHAEMSRTKRRQLAEERAGKVGVKLVFPLALCLFPALYVVCFGPVVVKIYRAFFEGQP